jgi:hypothetical protein
MLLNDIVPLIDFVLLMQKLYEHKEDARGRHEYRVDEVHGGYKVDQE